jgi:hypothetical protein
MSKLLAITATAGLGLSAAFLGAAYVIGGDSVFHDPRAMEGIKPLIDLATHKEWRWSGGDTIALNAPVNLRYQPHARPEEGKPNVTITGPAGVVEHVQFADGRIAADPVVERGAGQKVQAVVSGVPIRKFVVNGGETLELGHVDQARMDIHLNGSGSVRGDGKVGNLNLVVAGSGDADLAALVIEAAAKVTILGSGTAILAPRGSVEVFIAGSGHLKLASRPTSLRQNIVGSGAVEQLAGPPAPPAPPGPPASPPPPPPSGAIPVPMPVPVPLTDARPTQPGDIFIAGDTIAVTGNHDKDLGRIERDRLNLTVSGNANVTASGRVDRLKLSLSGSGMAKLGAIAVRDADITLTGSGDVTVAATGAVKVRIIGSGNVRLLKRPASLDQQSLGSGRVIEPGQ